MRRLQLAFSKKEKAEKLLPNLENLKKEGSIDDDQYEAMRNEYISLLEEGKSEISAIKDELTQTLEASRTDLEAFTQELKNLQVRIKVGELPAAQYERRVQKTRSKIEDLKKKIATIEKLLQANSSADVGGFIDVQLGKKRGTLITPRELISSVEFVSSFEEIVEPKTKLIGLIGGVLLFISVFLPWVSLVSIGFSISFSGIAFSGALGAIGIIASLGCVLATLVETPSVRGIAHISMGALALLIMFAIWFSQPTVSTQGVPREYWEGMERLVKTGVGFYLYVISSIAIVLGGVLEMRES